METPQSSSSGLPPGWKTAYDGDGEPYYYNRQLQRSQYEFPTDESPPMAPPPKRPKPERDAPSERIDTVALLNAGIFGSYASPSAPTTEMLALQAQLRQHSAQLAYADTPLARAFHAGQIAHLEDLIRRAHHR